MPLMVGCIGILFPRVALFLVWLLRDGYLESAFPNRIWLLLGFIFLPLTTLAFAFVSHSMAVGGSVSAFGWLLTAIAFLIDVGLVGRGHRSYRRRELD